MQKHTQTTTTKSEITIPEVLTVKDFADRTKLPVTMIIGELMKNGILATINETIDFETAEIIADDLGVKVAKECNTSSYNCPTQVTESKNLVPRPPVVAIMGHVDHGKTTLLDNIRASHVAAGESGGITQHISAYQVTLSETKNTDLKHKTITFIDTPGHAAFSAMREHGTAITDIIVLIVAANDGVKPQTLEVIEQAKLQHVPLLVAINKVDLPDADVMRTKQQLSEHDLLPEDWGGKTIMVEISGKTGQGVDDLLEMILLQADMMELKADPNEKAVGVVIESHMQKGTGPVGLILIENGSLKVGDPIAIGSVYGKVRILEDFLGNQVKNAGPSFPVRVAGLKSLPNFGDRLLAFDSDQEARDNAIKIQKVGPNLRIATAKKISNDTEDGKSFELNIILKCDVKGSLDAVIKSLSEINTSEYSIKIVSDGVGAITESDITLAKATNSEVLGFRVNVLGAARKMADKEEVKIKTFQVIYELVDFAKEELSAILPPEITEEPLGEGKVLGIFRDDKKGFVAGGMIENGKLTVGDEIKFLQGKSDKYRAKILSLRREKSEVKECESGNECGFGLPVGANVSVGDKFIAFKTVSTKRKVA